LTSERKIRANRANALASTGPKTAQGRARATRNALRHGLSVPICSDPILSTKLETIAHKIVGTHANAKLEEPARRIAEAELEVCRARRARYQLLISTLCNSNYDSSEEQEKKTPVNFDRLFVKYEKLKTQFPVFAQRFAALFNDLEEYVRLQREQPRKVATIRRPDMSKQLASLDRYERRALSRRNLAIRAFDDLRRRLHGCGSIN